MTRRGNNEGSIYRRKDGRWVAAVSLLMGKRRYVYGKTRQEVARKLNAALTERELGIPVPRERLKLKDFLQQWLKDRVKASVRPRTYQRHEQLVRVHISPTLGNRPLSRLGAQEVQSFYNYKLSTGLSPRTVEYIHAVLRSALGQALKWDLVSRNVATLVDVPRPRREEIQPLNRDQVRDFLQVIQGHRMEALYVLCLGVGLRQGEALGLRWADVNFEAGSLQVRGSLQYFDGKFHFVEPKTLRSRRSIALPDSVVHVLRNHHSSHLGERDQAGSLWEDWGLVFSTRLGRPLNRHNVTRDFQALLKRAGLPRLRFHDLRHTCASLMLLQDVQPRMVMEVLGHSQISLTMNTYAHVMPAVARDAADRMDAIFAG